MPQGGKGGTTTSRAPGPHHTTPQGGGKQPTTAPHHTTPHHREGGGGRRTGIILYSVAYFLSSGSRHHSSLFASCESNLPSVQGQVIRSFGPHCTQMLPLKGGSIYMEGETREGHLEASSLKPSSWPFFVSSPSGPKLLGWALLHHSACGHHSDLKVLRFELGCGFC